MAGLGAGQYSCLPHASWHLMRVSLLQIETDPKSSLILTHPSSALPSHNPSEAEITCGLHEATHQDQVGRHEWACVKLFQG